MMAKRGFASMTPDRRRRIASLGGKAAHAKGTGHEWTSAEARAMGRLGGYISRGGRGRSRGEKNPKALIGGLLSLLAVKIDDLMTRLNRTREALMAIRQGVT